MNEKIAVQKLREFIRIKHLSISTENAYADFLVRYIRFIRKYPANMSSEYKFERAVFLIVPAWLLCLVGLCAALVNWHWLDQLCQREFHKMFVASSPQGGGK